MNKLKEILIIASLILFIVFISLQFFNRSNDKQNDLELQYSNRINQLEIQVTKISTEKEELKKQIFEIDSKINTVDSLRYTNFNSIKYELFKIKKFTPVKRSNHVDSVFRAAGIRK